MRHLHVDSRVETWVLREGPRPMVAQLRDWLRLAHRNTGRAVLVDVDQESLASWPVLALVGRIGAILQAQQSALGLVVNQPSRERATQIGLSEDIPVFSDLPQALVWAERWLADQDDRSDGVSEQRVATG